MNAQQPAESGRNQAKWLPLVLLVLALALYVPTVSKGRVVTDSHAAAAGAWRIATTGSPWMEGVDTSELEGSLYHDMWIVEGAEDHRVHNRTPGTILSGVPFYWALNNDADPADFQIWVGGVAAAVFTAIAGLFFFFAMRPRIGALPAFVSTAVLLFATPVWSVSADALWTQNITILALAGALWSASRRSWWMAGAFFALGIFARAHVAVIAAVVGLYLGWHLRSWRPVLQTGLTSSFGLMMLASWNRLVFGSWDLKGGYNDYVTENLLSGPGETALYTFANFIGFVFSPDRGILVWTPLILLLLPSLMASWTELPYWSRAFVWGGLIYSGVQLQINSFQGGQGFYGYRLALELLLCLAPALIYAYRQTAYPTRLVAGALVGIQFAAISVGAVTDQYYIEGGDMWKTNAFLLALADRPAMLGVYTVACVAGGVWLSQYMLTRETRRAPVSTAA